MAKFRYQFAIILTSLIYGFIGVFVKYIGSAIPLGSIVFLRFFFGVMFLAVVIPLIDRHAFSGFREHWKHHLLMGFLLAASVGTYTAALHLSSVSMVTIIWSSYVFSTAILAYFLLNEHLTLRCLFAMLVGFSGLIILNPLEDSHTLGNSIALVSAFMYSLMLVLLRRDGKSRKIGMLFWQMLFACLFLLPAPFLFGIGQLSGMPLLWIVLLGLLCTGLAYLLLDYGLEEVDADTASVLILAVSTVASLALAILLLGEPLTLRLTLGAILLVGAGILMEVKRFRIRHGHHR